MKILTFKLNYADKRWNEYLKDMFGEELAEKCKVESVTTAEMQYAIVNILNFNGHAKLLQAVKSDKNIRSAFIVEKNNVKKVLV